MTGHKTIQFEPVKIKSKAIELKDLKEFIEQVATNQIAKVQQELDDLEIKKEKWNAESQDMHESIRRLKEEEALLKFGKIEALKESKLSKGSLDEISNSLMPVGSVMLRRLPKRDVITILLVREALLYKKMHQFEESLKHNDREVFQNLKKEVMEKHSYLLDTDKAYAELQESKKKCKELQKEINLLNFRIFEFKRRGKG